MSELIPRPKVYRVGENAEIVTGELEQAYNRFMQCVDDMCEAITEFGRNMDTIKVQERQRVKDDVKRKRIEMMRRRK